MARPIIWALGVLGGTALSAVLVSDRMAARMGHSAAPPRASAASASAAALTVSADLRGHFVLHPMVDGHRMRMLVDTGASQVALSQEDARNAGILVAERDFTDMVRTANGAVRVAPVRIRELRVGDILVRDVEAVVLPAGRLDTSLLGMTFLRRLGSFEISAGRLTLRS